MQPGPGERFVRFVGDFIEFSLSSPAAASWRDQKWEARLRTNLGRAETQRREIVEANFEKVSLAGASWRDIPMRWEDGRWVISLPLTEVGYFSAKPYVVDPEGHQHWPDGDDIGISIHPEDYRTGNTVYCAFTRMFGPGKTLAKTINEEEEARFQELEKRGLTVIPQSGTLRDLKAELPFIINDLGCRIVHLLPVNPTPTTMAKMGRFGSPYAAQNLAGIDPALVDFDEKSTGVEQFCELTYEAHHLGGKIFLDLVINHTGWGSDIFEDHPEWFIREADGQFESPGAWGVKWGDLVELAHKHADLWDYLSEVFLTWCRRGVDGFRCDAGYKVPAPAWQHIIARVRQEFPAALFLLEGLGGGWVDTETLLTEGGMQWAYSELFQEFKGPNVAGYLEHSYKQSDRVGLLVHYSETHDNDRLSERGKDWSLLRNRLCGLTSPNGGFGFTCGVEWLAPEKIKVHAARGLNWGAKENIVTELKQLNDLISDHPAFFDGAKISRLSESDSVVYAIRRDSAAGADTVLVLANTDTKKVQTVSLNAADLKELGATPVELLGQELPQIQRAAKTITFQLAASACHCLGAAAEPTGVSGDQYRNQRLLASRALGALTSVQRPRNVGSCDWQELSELVSENPAAFLAAASALAPEVYHGELIADLKALTATAFPNVIDWALPDRKRITVVPDNHWLLIDDRVAFRGTLTIEGQEFPSRVESVQLGDRHLAWFPPIRGITAKATLALERYTEIDPQISAGLLFQSDEPGLGISDQLPARDDIVLLTNGCGAMSRICVDLGRVKSKYDCVLGANLDAALPVDRHIFVKRLRLWVDADGFITPLDYDNLVELNAGTAARWKFVASAGDGRSVEIHLIATMVPEENTVLLRFERPEGPPRFGRELPADCKVRLTARFDIEDRSFHWETKRNGGSEAHFNSHCGALPDDAGFSFQPAGRTLELSTAHGRYHPAPEWSENLPHAIEATRGMTASGDGFSPGWFELPLAPGGHSEITISADRSGPFEVDEALWNSATPPSEDAFADSLIAASKSFLVRRDDGKTVIAGYPWFLDWGRDTLICARGLLAAGLIDEVRDILIVFARFEEKGTLPNTIHGANASNRDTSDAPLWFGVVCEDLAAIIGDEVYALKIDDAGRTIAEVLQSIGENHLRGTPNKIHVDHESGLVWSPSHFTWMDTNFPAGTPREGYPVEIQALWIRLLRQLGKLGGESHGIAWNEHADRAYASFNKLFWLEEQGWFADLLIAGEHQPASEAIPDQALRSNCLKAISLGLVRGEQARRTVTAARRHLVIPGAIRSLAPLPVTPPLPVKKDGQLLNNPDEPYWGTYEGDEDTRRKPAYHNGTAWTWPFPVFCEALLEAWEHSPAAIRAAKSYLASMEHILRDGCVGQIPEVLDGDAPHTQRGCDAQAWGATEAIRVWRILK
ncbi:MAG: amylo-alpha-1,6-glucosidase [Verrucomicrobiia bacterium]|jgi:predicted glycogen debranching enzyme